MVFARIVYALNWMNVGAIFFLMTSDLNTDVSGLGFVTATFYLGIGILQVPGGLLAAKYGPKKVVVAGIFLFSLAALGTSFVSTIAELAALRFVVGAGMAFVFAPGIVIISRLIRGEKSGIGVGLFNSAFDIGGLVALFGWVIVATMTGWRLSLTVSGGLGVVTGLLVMVLVPRDEVRAEFRVSLRPLVNILKDRHMILFGVALLGFDFGNTIISGFMIYYLANAEGVSGAVAGAVTSLITIVPIFAALIAGRLYDTRKDHRRLVTVALLGSAVALALASFPTLYSAAASSALGGVVSAIGYTFGFAGARDLNREGKEYEGLAISWVNSIHLTGSFIPPVLFSFIVETLGYAQAWLWSAAITLVFLGPMLLMVKTWRD
jgi:MFS family permease